MVNSWSRFARALSETLVASDALSCLRLRGSPLKNKTLRRPRVTSVLTNIARAILLSFFFFFFFFFISRFVSFRWNRAASRCKPKRGRRRLLISTASRFNRSFRDDRPRTSDSLRVSSASPFLNMLNAVPRTSNDRPCAFRVFHPMKEDEKRKEKKNKNRCPHARKLSSLVGREVSDNTVSQRAHSADIELKISGMPEGN